MYDIADRADRALDAQDDHGAARPMTPPEYAAWRSQRLRQHDLLAYGNVNRTYLDVCVARDVARILAGGVS